jgi:hypothetical protein
VHPEETPVSNYEKNRANIPPEELMRSAGQWVALSSDGSRILARAGNLTELEERLTARGEDPEQVALEWIEWEGSEISI